MNNVLELKGKRFVQASKTSSGGGASMNSKKIVTREQLLRLVERISQIKEFWKHEKRPFEGILISVHYNKIVAKSNRIAGLFKGKDANYAIGPGTVRPPRPPRNAAPRKAAPPAGNSPPPAPETATGKPHGNYGTSF